LWYGPALPYSVGDQPWWEYAAREAAAMCAHAALVDLSPFTKIDVVGPDALRVMQQLCCSDVSAEGHAIYTQMLNPRGGIEADVTVTRFGDRFRVTSGAATRWKDLAWVRRGARGFDVNIVDRSEDEAVIGVMGSAARSILGAAVEGFAFGEVRRIEIAGQPLNATRVSFVGELGWELAVPMAGAEQVWRWLAAQGCTPLGHFALDGCRIEKGFKHWGHDLGPDITPLQAGLGFCVDWSKVFIGKAALQGEREDGLRKRLLLFDLPEKPLILHDEPIWSGGRIVGLTTSGAMGPRTGMMLAFGLVECAGETRAQSLARSFEIEVAGRRFKAVALAQPPYDPTGARMRA
jgi:4-methylaminobutanoate oxidase (formaldehyde-forming)